MQYISSGEKSEIIFEKNHALGIITLNRPKQLNALNATMIDALITKLKSWETDPTIEAVLILGQGEKAFCAGGDIVEVYTHYKKDKAAISRFFSAEYQLNAHIKHFSKPYIALMDGIVMGGGAGLSIHGHFRIATPKLIFAMPETGIGYFPDVGATYFLTRCPGKFGYYLGLTGESISCHEAYHAKLVDHIIEHDTRHDFILKLAAQNHLSNATILECLEIFQQPLKPTPLIQSQTWIEEAFSALSLEALFSQLSHQTHPLAQTTLKRLQTKSPTSLKVTLAALQRGATLSFAECMKMEHQLSESFIRQHDFAEGIRAALIDKDRQPKWQPALTTEVTPALVESYFLV